MMTEPLDDEDMGKLIRANSIFIYLLEREVRRSIGPYAIPQPVASGTGSAPAPAWAS